MIITLDEFMLKFSEALEDDNIKNISTDIDFRELESWDSLAGMSIIAMIDQEFNIRIKSSEMDKLLSIKQLYEFIINTANG